MVRVVSIGIVLLFSGLCALIFQVAWIREFRLVFGGTTAATGAVLAIFMGGLGIGNAFLGRYIDRHSNPLRFYAKLELVIAMSVAVSPMLIDLTREMYFSLGGQISLGLAGATLFRLFLSSLVLGIPTVAMGGTLPAAVRAVTSPDDERRQAAAFVYGLNTLGAVVGVGLSTFYLLEAIGTEKTLYAACSVNVILAVAAYILSWTLPAWDSERLSSNEIVSDNKQHEENLAVDDKDSPAVVEEFALTPRMIYVSAGIVGFAFFLMELVWYRMLTPLLGGTTYTFGEILAVVLLGIGLGGLFYPVIFQRIRPTSQVFAVTCLLEAVLLAFPFALGDELALWTITVREATDSNFASLTMGWTLIAFVVVFPAAFVAGLQFPLLVALLGRARHDVGKQIGYTFAFNTIGAISGSLLGGFGILPILSAPGTWIASVLILTILGMGIAAREWLIVRRKKLFILPATLSLLILLCLTRTGPTAVWRHSGIGAGRAYMPEDRSYNAIREWVKSQRRAIIWEGDGTEASLGIRCVDNGLAFAVNGKIDGNAIGDVATQMMLGLVGAMLHENPKTGLVVGLGTGESAGWLAEVDSMEKVEVVELEPAIQEMARRCAIGNNNVLSHPTIQLTINDARERLQTGDDRFDIIASEPSNPYRAGVASLYSQEFYLRAKDRLNNGGLFVQWLQAYEVDEKTVRMVLTTLRSVFPHVELWTGKRDDLLIVCANQPFTWSIEELRQRIQKEPFRTAILSGWKMITIEEVLAHHVCGTEAIDLFLEQEETPLINDDRNLIEFRFARSLNSTNLFSSTVLRQFEKKSKAAQLRMEDKSVDWDLVDDALWQYLGEMPDFDLSKIHDSKLAEEREARKKFSELFSTNKIQAIQAWESQSQNPRTFMELEAVARAYASLGREEYEELSKRLSDIDPLRTHIISAEFKFNRQADEAATDHLMIALSLFHKNPWIDIGLGADLMLLAHELAKKSRPLALQIFKKLEKPFALYSLNKIRRQIRFMIAELLGPEFIEECLEDLEPNVYWEELFLRRRLRTYKSTNNRLMKQAQNDLKLFVRNKTRTMP